MIEALIILVKILFYFSLINLAAGFVKPVYALWFLDRSNRLKVIWIYGSAAVILFLCKTMLQLLA
ncbi:hypothetical protein KIH41_01880 [Litoribacter ruber]|uniref:Uncharacterized protein n=1 Tax=Litoribacter ruber TaxID=702568 RepID=A0AAP2CI92_9BACT|nr:MULTISPECIES: hypothetical protein [Litoribacter]MBS9524174.1 hypothetical protein [Litoribacter alkaliphilus]MBT0810027.1 hypothetical protein [Litoribacter ruber]